jgi:hypothetical protein
MTFGVPVLKYYAASAGGDRLGAANGRRPAMI